LLKWKVIGNFPKELKQYIVIAAPHTHWHDFHMGLLLRKVTHTKINFVAKKELFKWPLGWLFKRLGGYALDRTPGQKSVDAYAGMFKKNEKFILNIAPEGTRKKVTKWKTGFYYIAKKADVPIVMVAFDFKNKQHIISKPFYVSDNVDNDFKHMYSFFDGIVGKVPEYS
jgi:1-acyl-sn-glycerol-3-phosphate acyltransferase